MATRTATIINSANKDESVNRLTKMKERLIIDHYEAFEPSKMEGI